MIKNITLAQRISLGFLLVVIMLAGSIWVAQNALENNQQALRKAITTIEAEKVRKVAGMLQHLIALQRAEKNIILAKSLKEREEYRLVLLSEDKALREKQLDVEQLVDNAGNTLLKKFEHQYHEFRTAQKQVIKLTQQNSNVRARELSQGKGREAYNNVRSLFDAAEAALQSLVKKIDGDMKTALQQAEENFIASRNIIYAIAIFSIIIAILTASLIINSLTTRIRILSERARQIAIGNFLKDEEKEVQDELSLIANALNEIRVAFTQITTIAEQMADGEFNSRIEARSTNDSLAAAINQMANNIVEATRQANVISQGDYTANITPKGEKDSMGIALQQMTKTLRDVSNVAEGIVIGDYRRKVEVKGDNRLVP